MQHAELERRHCIYLLLDELNPLEASGLVQHEAAVAEAGIVEDDAAGKRPGACLELLKSSAGAENALFGKRLDRLHQIRLVFRIDIGSCFIQNNDRCILKDGSCK